MRPTPRKKAPAPTKKSARSPKSKASDAERELLRMHKRVADALVEIKAARDYLAKSYSGPEHEHLEWAQSILEKALTGAAVAR